MKRLCHQNFPLRGQGVDIHDNELVQKHVLTASTAFAFAAFA